MRVYLPTKCQVSSIILTSFRQEKKVGNFTPSLPPPTPKKKQQQINKKQTPKKPTIITVNWVMDL